MTERDWARELFQNHELRAGAMEAASIESGHQALKALLLLNGGACIALLGFLSSTFDPEAAHQPELVNAILASLRSFGWGAGCAVLASALAYLTNSFYAGGMWAQKKQWEWPYLVVTDESRNKWLLGRILNWFAVAAGAISLGFFILGLIRLHAIY